MIHFLVKDLRALIVFCCYLLLSKGIAQINVEATLDFSKTKIVSPLIYGFNQNHEGLFYDENWESRRLGGNRLSVFNWENGASNSGHDINTYPNDNRISNLVGVPFLDKDKAGEVYVKFHQNNLDAGVTSIITVPILGWVANDKNGTNLTFPPSDRWSELVFKKPTSFSVTPDLNDGIVYLDECVNFLTDIFGDATTANGVKYISLDNEPAFWDNTHQQLQTDLPLIDAYIDKVIEAATAVKLIDPNVKIIVGEFAGINIYDFGNVSDWGSLSNGYDWFPSYFLDKLKKASDNANLGISLIDIISFHFYPQHKVDTNGNFSSSGVVVKDSQLTPDYIRNVRMNFTRSLWDETYIEPSWLTNSKLKGASNKILLRLQNSIDTYFPGIKMMIGEYDYGFDTDISHGIGIVDFLGASAQFGLEIANRWDLDPSNNDMPNYTSTAYQLYRNYDGRKSTYGNMAVESVFNQRDKASVWASLNSENGDLHLILINKSTNSEALMDISLMNSDRVYEFKDFKIFDATSTNMQSGNTNNLMITDDKVNCKIAPLTACHLVLKSTSLLSADSFENLDKVSILPIPFNDMLFVQSLKTNVQEIQIINISGVLEKIITSKGISGEFKLNTTKIKPGVYFLKIKTQNGNLIKKVIKN